eukprot:TRINITY_DN19730_c0_g2_i1.p1 TRINITY_DN19730_c0_g2~~TRINITY_DN19730_c0_g2_i1.p1  ORF type:complete len:361 (+),score=58.90 TRINITY_DN19730_c0_g2_i1:66-1085(+)
MSEVANTESIKTCLLRALTLAQQAVSADTEGDRVTALTLYDVCVKDLERIIPFVPEGHAKVMKNYSRVYTQRVLELKMEVSSTVQKETGVVIPKFPIHFIEQVPPALGTRPEVPSHIRRPFWLMKVLSLSVQTGVYITDDLYSPKDVWTQDGGYLFVKGFVAKTRYCEQMVDLMGGFAQVDLTNVDLVAKELDVFMKGAEAALKQLQKEIPNEISKSTTSTAKFDKQPSQAQRAWSAFRSRINESKKTEPSVAYNSYLPWLVSLLEASLALDAWLGYYSTAPLNSELAVHKLSTISSHLYFGFCSFVSKDLFTLLNRYIRKLRESYSRLFPDNFLIQLT